MMSSLDHHGKVIMEVYAELVSRDGSKRPFQVGCERSLKGLIAGLDQLKGDVSVVLSELVIQEKEQSVAGGAHESADEEDDEEEDDTEDDNKENGSCSNGPPIKRTKTQHQ